MSRRALGLGLLGLAMLTLAGCAGAPRRGVVPGVYTEEERMEASDRYQRLITHVDSRAWTEARELARSLLDEFPGFAQEDHVLLLGAQAATELREDRVALQWLRQLTEAYPGSPYRGEAWWRLAALYESRRDPLATAKALVEAHGASTDPARRTEAQLRLKSLVDEQLSIEEMEELAQLYSQPGIGDYCLYLSLQRRRERFEDPAEIGSRLERFLRSYPDSRHAGEVRAWLGELRQSIGYELPADLSVVLPDQIGILCPLTGEYAALGQAMYDGALLALEEHTRATGDAMRLISLLSQGVGVRGVLIASRLFVEEGVIAIVGALLSPTTIAVATLCEERDVPLVSPTATQENITELGPHVFQTNLTRAIETRLLAQVGVQSLLRRRYAILYPNTEEGIRAADLFAAEVEARGAQIVAREGFDRGVADFRDVIGRLRQAGPEAMFLPVAPSEIRLIAPQLTFHNLETQLFGPSSWNNSLLGGEVADYLDRAIFPSDIALIPEAERTRFEDLWQRKFRQTSANPFGLKTYYAVRQILTAISAGVRTREDLQSALQAALSFEGEGGMRLGMEKLRILDGGEITAFPVSAFPVVVPEPPPTESYFLLDSDR